MESQSALIEQSFSSRYSLNVREALDELPENFTVTDPSISGHPIVFASRGFLKMCGYSRDEVIGRNGRIFQGPRTHRRSVMQIREAIREERTVEVNLLNYRKDGTPFWMLFRMSPIFNKEDGTVTHFIAVQIPILRSRRGLCGGNNSTSRTNGENLWEAMAFSSCRRELCSEGIVDLCHALEFSPIFDSHTSEPCEANEVEKRRAASAIDSILSLLTHSSEMTGRLICGKKSSCFGTSPLGSSITTSLGQIKQSFVLTDVNAPDMPIVYASNAFFKLTGYSQNEVLGRNCRFLSGADTDTSTVHLIKDSVQTEKSCTMFLPIIRKDGSSFWNFLHISPIRNALGKIAYFVGVQMDESSRSHGVSFEMRQKSTVGGVRVALRTLSMAASCSST